MLEDPLYIQLSIRNIKEKPKKLTNTRKRRVMQISSGAACKKAIMRDEGHVSAHHYS